VLQVFFAYLVDLVVGDPGRLPHPVIIIGKSIEFLENVLRPRCKSPRELRLAGVLLAAPVVAGAFGGTWALLWLLYLVHPLLALAAEIWLISTTIAARGLATAGGEIFQLLAAGDLARAREKVGWIVGRDTCHMDGPEVTRATVETVAENTVDGVVAPLFYALLGGAPLAMAYRAVNTLDSMVGYRNERYLDFGRFSARLDDVANYLPARLTGLFMLAAAWLSGRDARGALLALRRDACAHPSPNSGIPEAVVAGALGVRLGGLNYYGGVVSRRAIMGDGLNTLHPLHIRAVVDLMYLSAALAVGTGLGAVLLVNGLRGGG
jgi:adenosylcobinamide-phosphate synthase